MKENKELSHSSMKEAKLFVANLGNSLTLNPTERVITDILERDNLNQVSSQTTIYDLPPEIIKLISTWLDFPNLLSLRSVNKFFKNIFPFVFKKFVFQHADDYFSVMRKAHRDFPSQGFGDFLGNSLRLKNFQQTDSQPQSLPACSSKDNLKIAVGFYDKAARKEYKNFSPLQKKLIIAIKSNDLETIQSLTLKLDDLTKEEAISGISIIGWAKKLNNLEILKYIDTVLTNLYRENIDFNKKNPIYNNTNFTELNWACIYNQIDVVANLLKQSKKDINRAKSNFLGGFSVTGETPLITAAKYGHVEIVKLLLNNGADLKEEALYFAVKNGYLEIAKLLIENGANIKSFDVDSYKWALRTASNYGHLEIVNLLIQKETIINASKNAVFWDSELPQFCAAKNGHPEILKVLLEHGAYVNGAAGRYNDGKMYGKSPLIDASQNGYYDIVDILLKWGAEPNCYFYNGSPLIAAVENNHFEIVELLLRSGADPNVVHNSFWQKYPLHIAAKNGNLNIIKLLIEKKALINVTDRLSETPLHIATKYGHTSIVNLLLENGANINAAIEENDETALHLAAEHGHFDIIKLLLEKNAEVCKAFKKLELSSSIPVEHKKSLLVSYKNEINNTSSNQNSNNNVPGINASSFFNLKSTMNRFMGTGATTEEKLKAVDKYIENEFYDGKNDLTEYMKIYNNDKSLKNIINISTMKK